LDGKVEQKRREGAMMKRKIGLALAAIIVATGLMANPAVAEKHKKKKDNSSSGPTVTILDDNQKKARITEILDKNVDQFPPEFRALSILTLGLSFSNLFGDRSQGGKTISEVVTEFAVNWNNFKRWTEPGGGTVPRGDLDPAYRNKLNYDDISKILPELVNASSTVDANLYWRDLYTKDLEYTYTPSGRGDRNADHKALFQNFELLDSDIFGNVQFAFLTLNNKTAVQDDGTRQAVEKVLSSYWISKVGHFSYYDLFTQGHDDVTQERYEAIAVAIDYQVIRTKSNGLVKPYFIRINGVPTILAGGGGNDCCCQNPNQYGKKTCFDSPDLGCTSTGTGTNRRCTLGSVACPAGTNCPAP